MKRNRSQAVVCRNGKLLLVEHRMKGRDFFNLPGGGIEEDETPAEAALRELSEEAGVEGRVIRPLAIEYKPDLESRIFTFLVEIPEDAVPQKGTDPELSEEEQTIVGVSWFSLREIPERDRAYLFGAGLMRIPEFHDEVLKWPDDVISYPMEP
ncbi:MAG: NUDIX domain-containing protein [Eubacterium sp.]|nr:NUDIX domain-containing protein [Eubacterium sp.]